jgi:hypothetical protein
VNISQPGSGARQQKKTSSQNSWRLAEAAENKALKRLSLASLAALLTSLSEYT